MPTIVNNPNGSDSGSGWAVGVVVVIVLLLLFFIFGLPALRGNTVNLNTDTNSQMETGTRGTPPPENTTNNFNSTTTINVVGTSTDDR